MRISFRSAISALSAAVFVIGCSTVARTTTVPLATPAPTLSLPPGAIEIPTATTQPGVDSCVGEGYKDPIVLEGDPTSSPAVWVTFRGGPREPVTWPIGYYARFNPTLEVLDPTGRVVAEAGTDMGNLQIGPGVVVCVGMHGGLVFTLP